MSQSTTGTTAPTPAASIRGDPGNTTSPCNSGTNGRPPRGERASAGAGGIAIPECKVNNTASVRVRQMVVLLAR